VPMVDCIMVLLIFLMISSAFVTTPASRCRKPDVSGVQAGDQNALLIAISADNRIYFDGRKIRPERGRAGETGAIGRSPRSIIAPTGRPATGVLHVYSEAKRRAFRTSSLPRPAPTSPPPPWPSPTSFSRHRFPPRQGWGRACYEFPLGAGVTLALFLGIARFDRATPTAPPDDILDLRAGFPSRTAAPPREIPPRDPVPLEDTLTGWSRHHPTSPVQLAVTPPDLESLLPRRSWHPGGESRSGSSTPT